MSFELLKCVSPVCARLFGVLTTLWCTRRTAPQVPHRPHGSEEEVLLQPSSARELFRSAKEECALFWRHIDGAGIPGDVRQLN